MFASHTLFQDSIVFEGKAGAYPSKTHSDPLKGRLLALSTKNRQGWKGLPGANIAAYYENSLLMAVNNFITFAPGVGFCIDFNRVFHCCTLVAQ